MERQIYISLGISVPTCSWWAASCSVMSWPCVRRLTWRQSFLLSNVGSRLFEVYSQEGKGVSWGWKVGLQGNVNHAEPCKESRNWTRSGSSSAPSPPLGGKRNSAMLHCIPVPALYQLIRGHRYCGKLDQASPFLHLHVREPDLWHHSSVPTCLQHDGRAAGLGPRGFAAAATASLWLCTGHHSSVREKAGVCSSFYIDLVVFCLWGFVCVGAGGKGRIPDSKLNEFHLSCIFFSKTRHGYLHERRRACAGILNWNSFEGQWQ